MIVGKVLYDRQEKAVAFGIGGEYVGDVHLPLVEGDDGHGGVEAGGGEGFHEDADGVGVRIGEGELEVRGLRGKALAIDVPVAASPAAIGCVVVAAAAVVEGELGMVVVQHRGGVIEVCFDGLDGVDGDGGLLGAGGRGAIVDNGGVNGRYGRVYVDKAVGLDVSEMRVWRVGIPGDIPSLCADKKFVARLVVALGDEDIIDINFLKNKEMEYADTVACGAYALEGIVVDACMVEGATTPLVGIAFTDGVGKMYSSVAAGTLGLQYGNEDDEKEKNTKAPHR